ncbi:MAG: hypothetical protein ACJ757_04865 [Gaiellaceae bacterium]
MRKMGYVVEHFDVPPSAPEPVAKASENFDRLSEEYQATRAALHEAVTNRSQALGDAKRAAAEARVNRTAPPPSLAKATAAYDQKLAKLNGDVEELKQALDVAGDTLVELIVAHRDEWLLGLDEAEAANTERLRVALAEARSAASDLGAVRSAPEWLRAVNLRDAALGDQSQYHGGREVTVDPGIHKLDSFTPASKLLDMCDLIVAPEPKLIGYTDGEPVWA